MKFLFVLGMDTHNAVIVFRPSTFAQAAKLRRTAAAKEKELAKCTDIISVRVLFSRKCISEIGYNSYAVFQ